MSEMPDWIRQTFAEAERKLSAHLPPLSSADPIDVKTHPMFLPISDDLLIDEGVIPDTRPPVHIPWHRRLRWRFNAWREQVGRKVGGRIAGVDLSERDDW